jgi:hypothetical protein
MNPEATTRMPVNTRTMIEIVTSVLLRGGGGGAQFGGGPG